MTEKIAKILKSCDRKMPRYIAGVTLEDGLRSGDLAERSEVDKLDVLLKQRRLIWLAHVRRRGQEKPLGRLVELEVTERRPR